MTRNWPRRTRLTVITTVLAISAGSLLADRLRNIKPGEPLPPLSAEGLDGKAIADQDLAGKALAIVYVSARQRQSEQAIASAHTVIGNLGKPDLKLVFISADSGEATYFRELRDRLMAHEPFALDPQRTYYGKVGLIAFPTTIVTSKQGKLLHVIAGWSRDYDHQLEMYCRHALGEFDDAELAKRLESKPVAKNEARDKADRHRSTAGVLRKKGMLDGAIQELEQAVAADPAYADAIADLAEVLIQQERVGDAEKRINDLLARQPQYHRAKLVLGLVKLKRNQLDEAEKLLIESLVMNPDPVRAHYYLGLLYEKKGDHKAAMEHYRDALKRCLNEP